MTDRQSNESLAERSLAGTAGAALRRMLALAPVLFLLGIPVNSLSEGDLGRGFVSSTSSGKKPREISLGPGEVRFCFSTGGKWLDFFPEWSPLESAFEKGGFILFAKDKKGDLVQVGSCRNESEDSCKSGFWCKGACEGMMGGNRSPAPNADDDGDGLIDEDRLDGVDNDEDGAIDEDFAAIGDEMTVVEYRVRSSAISGEPLFHQESYAWALPNLENIVFLSLKVKNNGPEPWEKARLGTFFEIKGPAVYSERTIEGPSEENESPATALICESTEGQSFGLLLFPVDREERDAGWLHGVVDSTEGIIRKIINPPPAKQSREGSSSKRTSLMSGYDIKEDTPAIVSGVSPDLGTIEPGEEISMYMALIATKSRERMEGALVDAYRTFLGDGRSHFLPPPVTMKRKVIWGSYKHLPGDRRRTLIRIENARLYGVGFGNITFLSGMALDRIKEISDSGSDLVLEYEGRIPPDLFDESGRVCLRGRLDSGAIFEAVLRPQEETSKQERKTAGQGHASVEATERFWKKPGKLDGDLLKASPNPFRENTIISYEVPSVVEAEDGTEVACEGPFKVDVKIYNVTGRLVGVLADDILGPGHYEAQWSAMGEKGNAVASGVYYVKLQIEKKHITKRIILLK